MTRASTAVVTALALVALGAAAAATPAGGRPSPLRVGLVLTAGTDTPFEGIAYRGLVRARRELGVQVRVLVAGNREGSFPSLAYLARHRYDLVVAVGELQVEALRAAAALYPGVKFLVLDASTRELWSNAKNVQGTVFRVEQGAYLAGYLAALMERRRPGPDVVSTVGGMKLPQVDRFIAGFQAGARKGDPGIRTLNAYSGSFVDTARCRMLALRQIARGSGVVFQVASDCGLGALAAAKERGRFGVGVDSDQSGLGRFVLTSVVKRLDLALYRAVRGLVQGRLRTGVDTGYGLRNGGVELGTISPRVPPRLVRAVDEVRRRIVAGELTGIPTHLPGRG